VKNLLILAAFLLLLGLAGGVERAGASTASVFSIRSEPALGCWPWSPSRLAPGFYVAHKTLRCGTRVRVCYRGRCVRAVVRDRGPYVPGREWDLDVRVQRALVFPYGVAGVRVAVIR
jgi:hypothetical protein